MRILLIGPQSERQQRMLTALLKQYPDAEVIREPRKTTALPEDPIFWHDDFDRVLDSEMFKGVWERGSRYPNNKT